MLDQEAVPGKGISHTLIIDYYLHQSAKLQAVVASKKGRTTE